MMIFDFLLSTMYCQILFHSLSILHRTAVFGPLMWNKPPAAPRSMNTILQRFWCKLKTYLFQQ